MRCYHMHPKFPQQKCNALLPIVMLDGRAIVRCPRCHSDIPLDSRSVAALESKQVSRPVSA